MSARSQPRSSGWEPGQLSWAALEESPEWAAEEEQRILKFLTSRTVGSSGRSHRDDAALAAALDANVHPQHQSPWFVLPYDVELIIFSFLSPTERVTAACVCKAWRRIAHDGAFWRRMSVARGARIGAHDFRRLLTFHGEHLRELRISSSVHAEALQSLPDLDIALPRLRTLVLKRCGSIATAADAESLAPLVSRVGALGIIEQWGTKDGPLAELAAHAVSLQVLLVRHCPNVTPAAVHAFLAAAGSSLRQISLLGCRGIDASVLDSLTNTALCPALQFVRIVDCDITDTTVASAIAAARPSLTLSTRSPYASSEFTS